MPKKYKVGVVGCGRIASLLEEDPLREKPATHAGAYAVFPRTKITAACDIDRWRLAKFRGKWRVPADRCYRDYREMLVREDIDIVSIATWTESHCAVALAAAKNPHVKGIYLEKPITADLREANRIITTCKRRGIKLLVGHERRFDSDFSRVREIVEKKEMGALKTIFAQALSLPPPKLSRNKYIGGTLLHDGTHLMDLVLHFGGPAAWVMGFDKRPHGKRNIETAAGGVIMLHSGVTVFVEGGGERNYFKFDLDMQFENGRIVIGNGGIHAFQNFTSRHYTGFHELAPVPFKNPRKRENSFIGCVRELVRAIDSGREPVSSGTEARDALELILAIYHSADNSGKKVHFRRRKR